MSHKHQILINVINCIKINYEIFKIQQLKIDRNA